MHFFLLFAFEQYNAFFFCLLNSKCLLIFYFEQYNAFLFIFLNSIMHLPETMVFHN
jgi:hypothetical protein